MLLGRCRPTRPCDVDKCLLRESGPEFERAPSSAHLRKQTVPNQTNTAAAYSPAFSNASLDQHAPVAVTATAAAQKRSLPDGDHHLLFVEVAAPVSHPDENPDSHPRDELSR